MFLLLSAQMGFDMETMTLTIYWIDMIRLISQAIVLVYLFVLFNHSFLSLNPYSSNARNSILKIASISII